MNQLDNQTIGARIRIERKSRGLLLKKMADELGVSTDYLYEIENGKISPGADFFQKLQATYNIDPDYLIHGKVPDIPENAGQISFEDITSEEGIDSVEKLVALMNISPFIKNSILTMATRFVVENSERIKKLLDKKKP